MSKSKKTSKKEESKETKPTKKSSDSKAKKSTKTTEKPKKTTKKTAKPKTKKVKKEEAPGDLDPQRERVIYLHPSQIDNTAFQPRESTEPPEDLLEDIRRVGGNRTPVMVRCVIKNGKMTYEVYAGHLRVAAIIKINSELKPKDHLNVRCVVFDVSEKEAAMDALIDNLLHHRLSPGDRDYWIAQLVLKYGYTQKEVLARLPELNAATLSNIVRSYRDSIPSVIKMLEEREISTGHAKAIASLQPEEQEKLTKELKKSWKSVYETEKRVKQIRLRREAREKLTEYLKASKKKKLKIPGDFTTKHDIIAKCFGGFYHEEFKVQEVDVDAALKEVGIEVIVPEPRTPTEISKDLAEAEKTAEEKKREPRSICKGCDSFVFGLKEPLCIQGIELKAEEIRLECDLLLPGQPSHIMIQRCPFCNGLTQQEKDSVYYVDVSSEPGVREYWVPGIKPGSYWAHSQCLLIHLAKLKRLTGKCEECMDTEFCEIPTVVNNRSLMKIHIEECDDGFTPGVDIEALNTWAQETYLGLVKDFLAEKAANEKEHQKKAAKEAA